MEMINCGIFFVHLAQKLTIGIQIINYENQ